MKLATELRSLPTAAAICSCVRRELVGQPLIRERFVDRIEIFALKVLDESELQQLFVAVSDIADDDRNPLQARSLRRTPATLTGNDSIVLPVRRTRIG